MYHINWFTIPTQWYSDSEQTFSAENTLFTISISNLILPIAPLLIMNQEKM